MLAATAKYSVLKKNGLEALRNEAVEMLFLAAQRGEPVAFSCTRPDTPVLKRGDGVPEAREERQYVVALHNGWPGFLYPFVMPGDYRSRVFGMDRFSRSGKPDEIHRNAGFDYEGLRKKILDGHQPLNAGRGHS
jgi:hypothetical protein